MYFLVPPKFVEILFASRESVWALARVFRTQETADVVNVSALVDGDVQCLEFLHQLSILLHQFCDGFLHLLQCSLFLTHLLLVLLQTDTYTFSHTTDNTVVCDSLLLMTTLSKLTTHTLWYCGTAYVVQWERMSNTILSRGIYFLFIATSTFHRLLQNLARCYLQRRLSWSALSYFSDDATSS